MEKTSKRLQFLPEDCLVKTGPVDYASWTYNRGILGHILRQRYHMALHLMGDEPCQSLLEIGYGSGIFLPELARRSQEVHGIDIHEHAQVVTQALQAKGVSVKLQTAPAEKIPYADSRFDCIIAMSCMEFVADLDQVCREVRRVMRPEGSFIVLTPAASPIVDFGLLVLTGNNARKDFGNRREQVLPALKRCFHIAEQIRYPKVMRPVMYRAFKLTK